MARSPVILQGAKTRYRVKVDKKWLEDTVRVVSLNIWRSINRVPRAQVVVLDGNPTRSVFAHADGGLFKPGAAVEIHVGYDAEEDCLFKGVVSRHSVEITSTTASRLVIDLADEALKMSLGRKTVLHEGVTDSALMTALIGDDLEADVTATTLKHEQVVQHYVSDWDLMLMRAELNGMVAIVTDGVVKVGPPVTSEPAALVVKYGDGLLEMTARIDATAQFAASALKAYAWDVETQALQEAAEPTCAVESKHGDLSVADLSAAFDQEEYALQTAAPIGQDALNAWTMAELLKITLGRVRGHVRFQGSAKALVGTVIDLAGVGNHFNGPAYISGVHHNVTDNRWVTEVHFGLSTEWFPETAVGLAAPEAGGQMAPVRGLQTGVVKKIAVDPAGGFRVFVSLPLLNDDEKGVWARLAGAYASSGVGAVFYPEKGDEVVIAFMDNDPRYPVILGSLYSKSRAPAYPPDETNKKKAIVTRSKLEITFDDEKKIIEIRTPDKQSVTLDDTAKTIVVKDSNGNTVTMAKAGVSIDCAADITLTAKGDIVLDAANILMKARTAATTRAPEINHNADKLFSAKGSLKAELVSSLELTVKSAMVKIN